MDIFVVIFLNCSTKPAFWYKKVELACIKTLTLGAFAYNLGIVR
jgi:hypothetical protein